MVLASADRRAKDRTSSASLTSTTRSPSFCAKSSGDTGICMSQYASTSVRARASAWDTGSSPTQKGHRMRIEKLREASSMLRAARSADARRGLASVLSASSDPIRPIMLWKFVEISMPYYGKFSRRFAGPSGMRECSTRTFSTRAGTPPADRSASGKRPERSRSARRAATKADSAEALRHRPLTPYNRHPVF